MASLVRLSYNYQYYDKTFAVGAFTTIRLYDR